MNEPSKNDSPDVSKLDAGRLLLIAALVGVVVFGGYAYLTSQQERQRAEKKAKEQANENVELQQKMANLSSKLEDLETAKLYKLEQQSVAAVNALSIIERGQLLRQQFQQLDQTQIQLRRRIADLEQSDEGRKIASDPFLVQQVSAALAVKLPSEDITQGMASRLDQFLVTPQKAVEQKIAGYLPTPSFLKAFAAFESETGEALATVKRVLGDLNAIGAKAANLPVGDGQTLRDALTSLDLQLKGEQSELMAKTIAAAEQESLQLLADQETANKRKIGEAARKARALVGDVDAAKIVADAQAMRAEQDEAQRKKAEEEAKKQLERDFKRDLPDIRSYLVGYISEGYELRGENSASKGPASLRVMRSLSILQPGRKGLTELMYYVTFKNDRPRGPIPMYIGSEQGWQRTNKDVLNRAQQLLIKYGDLMVKKGLLAE